MPLTRGQHQRKRRAIGCGRAVLTGLATLLWVGAVTVVVVVAVVLALSAMGIIVL